MILLFIRFETYGGNYHIKRGGNTMNATTNTNSIPLNEKMTLSTPELMQVLSCGRATAVEIGMSAQSRIVIGRRVLWNADKIREYIDSVSA